MAQKTWMEARIEETEEAFEQYKIAVAKAGIAIYHYRLAGAPEIPEAQRTEVGKLLGKYVRRSCIRKEDLEEWIMTGTLEEHGWGLDAYYLGVEARELERLATIIDRLACPEVEA